jgi:mannosyltransferase
MTSLSVATRANETFQARPWLLALPAACLTAGLGLYQLGDASFWIDEAFTARAVSDYGYVRLGDELYWLYYTLMKPWAALAGTSEIALRLPSVAGGVAAVVLLFAFARRMFDEQVALVASLLLAVNPFFVQWTQQARGYSLLVALAIASTWLLMRARERDDVVAWAGYGVSAAVLVYWHAFAAFVLLPVHAVVAWRSGRARATWALVLVGTTPWVVQLLDRDSSQLPLDWIETPSLGSIVRFLVHASGAAGFGLVLAVVGIAYARQRPFLVAWATLPPALSLVVTLVEPVFVHRYLIVCCPAFALLGAFAIVRVSSSVRTPLVAVAAGAAVFGLAYWYAPDGSRNWQGEDWKRATAFAMAHGGAEVRPDRSLPAYRYYGGRVAKTGLVIERRRRGAFPSSPYVVAQFGRKLRALRLPQQVVFERRAPAAQP